MKVLAGTAAVVFFVFAVPETCSAENDNFQFKKQAELQQIRPKKPIRIKLKRTAKTNAAGNSAATTLTRSYRPIGG